MEETDVPEVCGPSAMDIINDNLGEVKITSPITLETNDGKHIDFPAELIKYSSLLNGIVQVGFDNTEPTPISMVNSGTLQTIITWLENYHSRSENDKKDCEDKYSVVITDFDKTIIDMQTSGKAEQNAEIIKAVNFLGITPLHNISLSIVAAQYKALDPHIIKLALSHIKGKTPLLPMTE